MYLNCYYHLSKGITSRLDHFVSIGANVIWLSPIFKSPMADFGYDISDFTAIDPIFGTLRDFIELTAAAKSKGDFIFKKMLKLISLF